MFVSLVAVFAGIQFIPANLNQNSSVPGKDIILYYDPPEEVASLIKTSCYDCHSNNTVYPWYNKIQPISLLLEKHIKDAKEELNFSEFASYSKRKQKSKLKSVINQIDKNEMPLKGYLILHQDAGLSESEKETIINWMKDIKDSL
jgi:hypothetical protein